MLARIEETLQADIAIEVQKEMTAIEMLLGGLFDYAGLYPPASLDMRTAVDNYLGYMQGVDRGVLGRFVVQMDRIGELRGAAGPLFPEMKLSVIVPPDADVRVLRDPGDGLNSLVIEYKVSRASEIEHMGAQLTEGAECYFEVPMGADERLLKAIKANGARVKLRMGGVTAEAFPPAKMIILMLKRLADLHLAFKATAGLHHPIRSSHAFTYEPGSPAGTMNGFLNVAGAATLLHFGGSEGEALQVLEEEDPGAWQITREAIGCGAFFWSIDQLRAMRKQFFISIGSCSFEEPIKDLESLGWL